MMKKFILLFCVVLFFNSCEQDQTSSSDWDDIMLFVDMVTLHSFDTLSVSLSNTPVYYITCIKNNISEEWASNEVQSVSLPVSLSGWIGPLGIWKHEFVENYCFEIYVADGSAINAPNFMVGYCCWTPNSVSSTQPTTHTLSNGLNILELELTWENLAD
jgi:hypothetical protein